MRVAAGLMAVAGLWVGMSVGASAFVEPRAVPFVRGQAAEQDEFDFQVESLSVAPPGSVAEAYLAFANYRTSPGGKAMINKALALMLVFSLGFQHRIRGHLRATTGRGGCKAAPGRPARPAGVPPQTEAVGLAPVRAGAPSSRADSSRIGARQAAGSRRYTPRREASGPSSSTCCRPTPWTSRRCGLHGTRSRRTRSGFSELVFERMMRLRQQLTPGQRDAGWS